MIRCEVCGCGFDALDNAEGKHAKREGLARRIGRALQTPWVWAAVGFAAALLWFRVYVIAGGYEFQVTTYVPVRTIAT